MFENPFIQIMPNATILTFQLKSYSASRSSPQLEQIFFIEILPLRNFIAYGKEIQGQKDPSVLKSREV